MRADVPVATGNERKDEPQGITLTDEQMRKMILSGNVNREDLSITERERYREELKKARRY